MSNDAFVRNLIFKSNDLGKQSDLLLTFNSPMPGMYEDYFPVVWRVHTFGAEGAYAMRATYSGQQFSFTKPKVNDGIIIGALASVDINGRQQTTLTKDSGAFEFSAPVEASYMKAINDTGAKVDFTFDFKTTEASLPTPMLYYNNVENKSSITPRYDLKLRAYVTSDYTQGQILQGEITAPLLWEADLVELSETTTWNLTWDPLTGRYNITKA
ncbi:hypothetical protein F4604DRAFT_1741156 [Suillus subluteus]|nr:hypothetical protein F4604DRAFT_1741156 [Suillus subluteus]